MENGIIDATSLRRSFSSISAIMTKNRAYLIDLDSQNGDGDLGISMDNGYRAAASYLDAATESDLGRLFMGASKAFNEAAPSSLGTITAVALAGLAKTLKGLTSVDLAGLANAMQAGLSLIMEKAGAKPGEKTILDSLCPAVDSLTHSATTAESLSSAFAKAAEAASVGSEATRQMRSVHGRAAYYGDKSIGILDGGSVVGKLLFEALATQLSQLPPA